MENHPLALVGESEIGTAVNELCEYTTMVEKQL